MPGGKSAGSARLGPGPGRWILPAAPSQALLVPQVSPEQVILAHSPLQLFSQFHQRCMLVDGQGPVEENARKYPLCLCASSSQLRAAAPALSLACSASAARGDAKIMGFALWTGSGAELHAGRLLVPLFSVWLLTVMSSVIADHEDML